MSLLRPLARALPRYVSPSGSRPIMTTIQRKIQDPFPLPLSDPAMAAASSKHPLPYDHESIENEAMPKPLDRTGEEVETMRARLVYQSRKRGMLEGDLLISTFARDHLGTMSAVQLKEFDQLLDEPDWDIYYWAIGKREAPSRWRDTELLKSCVILQRGADRRLSQHAKNEGKVVRVMPSL